LASALTLKGIAATLGLLPRGPVITFFFVVRKLGVPVAAKFALPPVS